MNTLQLFKQAFFQFQNYGMRKMAFWKVISMLLFLSAILALPITKQVFSVLQEVQQDGQKLQKSCLTFLLKMARCKQRPKNLALFIKPTRLFLRLIQMENVQPLMSKRI